MTDHTTTRALLFTCMECIPHRDVTIVHEHQVDAEILGLPGKAWLRTYSCGHQYRVLDHSSRYRTDARGRRHKP